ncbi:hypothetical protein ACFFTM_13380 [Pseudoduganella plicata]|nr:hypothetical protein [Pseudoduganella plicata]QBQ35631.1 hypothetical protein E1742_05205 [Pseudoduganella plicata]
MSAVLKPQARLDGKPDAGPAQEIRAQDPESQHIDDWRRQANVPPDAASAGLAFSGGGIRSATLGLGVLEALRDLKLLGRFDYLSSVSGGGYIMGWLSAHCHRHPGWLGAERNNVARWDKSIAYLSKYSNYLSPRLGMFSADTWTMLTVWARNAFLVQLTVVCGIVVALLLPHLAKDWFMSWPEHERWRWASVALFVFAVLCIAANQLHQRRRAHPPPPGSAGAERKQLQVALGICGMLTVGCALLGWYLWQVFDFQPFPKALPVGVHSGAVVRLGAPAVPIAMLIMGGALAFVGGVACAHTLAGRESAVNFWPDFGQGKVQLLVVLPLLFTSVGFSAVLWSAALKHRAPPLAFGDVFLAGLGFWPFPLSFAFAAVLVLACCSFKRWAGTKTRLRLPRFAFNLFLIGVCSVLCIVLLHASFAGIVVLMNTFHPTAGAWHAFIWGPPLVLSAFASTVTLMIGILGRASLEGMREWWSRLAAWLWIYAIGWNVVAMSAIYGPTFVPWLANLESWQKFVPVMGWIGTTVAGLLAANSGATKGDSKIRSREPTAMSIGLEVVAKVAPTVFIVGLLLGVAMAINFVLVKVGGGTLASAAELAQCQPHDCWRAFLENTAKPDPAVVRLALGAVLLLLLVLGWRIDVNEFSLQAFYRSRLVRCYLGASRTGRSPQEFTQFDDDDDLPVTDLASRRGPLHLINCTVNLGGSKDLSLHTRHGASFTVTPYAIGSGSPINGNGAIGFRAHGCYDNGGMSLGEAMATSGAAASPNQGFHTAPSVAFMMTMFNARLGRWCANPRRSNTSLGPWFSLLYLVKELFGTADERSKYLMISDGGHFDNLGAYELIRRRCKLIVVVDAECDPERRFGALGTLLRLVQVDFDTRIDLDTAPLRPLPDSDMSKAHCAVGRIFYPALRPGVDAEEGVLVYIKASLTDAVRDASLWQYHATHPSFPHESTGDQFYGEDQFESYRRLGRHLAHNAFGAGLDADDIDRIVALRPDFADALGARQGA